jgi:hypothetical protein
MKKFTSTIMDDWNFDDNHAKYGIKVWYIQHCNNYVMK